MRFTINCDRSGLWVLTQRWSVSYWPPGVWKPWSIRNGRRGHLGWWGAYEVSRIQEGDGS